MAGGTINFTFPIGERWKELYKNTGGMYPTREDYFEQWHEYP
jgi:hypothetical protein